MTRIMNAYQFTGHENNAELRTMISNLRAPLGDAPLTNLSEYARRHGWLTAIRRLTRIRE